jgi:hypothetical protein
MPATYSYEEYTDLVFVSGFVMGMDVLLQWNIGSDIHIVWSLIIDICECVPMLEGDWFLPLS